MENTESPTKIDYFITFYFLMLTTKTTFIYYTDMFWFIFSIGAIFYGFTQKRIYEKDIYVFTTFSLFFLGYILFRNFAINKLPLYYVLSDIYYLIRYIFVAYVFCVVLKGNATKLFVNLVYVLSFVSLFFFAFQVAGGGEILYALGRIFLENTPNPQEFSETFSSILIFNYDQVHVYRNAGFVWEPGAFGCFLIIALFLNFLNNDFTYDRKTIIMIIALITTLSTTTYLALAILIFLSYRVRGGRWNIALISLLVLMVGAFIYLPFLGDKIKDTYEQDVVVLDDVEEFNYEIQYYLDYGGQVRLNRFSSAIFLHRHFKDQLLMGVSNAYVKLESKIYGVSLEKFNTSNGIMDFIVKFGIIGLVFVFLRIFQFAFRELKSVEYSIYLLIIILILNFGEPILMLPVTLMFLFFPDFNVRDDILDEESNDSPADLPLEISSKEKKFNL